MLEKVTDTFVLIIFITDTTSTARISREARENLRVYYVTHTRDCMQAQPRMVLGFADMGAKLPDWRPAIPSPDRCNGLPKGSELGI